MCGFSEQKKLIIVPARVDRLDFQGLVPNFCLKTAIGPVDHGVDVGSLKLPIFLT
jgi:hypothetical protein